MGFELENLREALLFWKWLYWKNGITTRSFLQERITDVRDVVEINGAIEQKQIRESKIRSMASKVRF